MALCVNPKPTGSEKKQKNTHKDICRSNLGSSEKNKSQYNRSNVPVENDNKHNHYWTLSKNKIYLGVLMTMFLFNFAHSVSGVFLPHFIRTKYPTSYSSQTLSSISILGAGDLCGRFIAGMPGKLFICEQTTYACNRYAFHCHWQHSYFIMYIVHSCHGVCILCRLWRR